MKHILVVLLLTIVATAQWKTNVNMQEIVLDSNYTRAKLANEIAKKKCKRFIQKAFTFRETMDPNDINDIAIYNHFKKMVTTFCPAAAGCNCTRE